VLAGAHLLERRVIKNFRARNPAGARGGAASSEFAKSAHSHKHRARRASVRACDKFQLPECISLSAKSRPCGIFALLIHSKFLFFLAGWLCAPTNGKFSNSVPSEIKRWNKLERTQTGGAQIVKRKLCFLPRWLSSFFGFESSD